MQPQHELLGGVRGRFVDEHWAPVLVKRVVVCIGTHEGGAVTEVVRGVAQGREHQVQFLTVIMPSPQRRVGLDEKDVAMGVIATIGRRPELVGEQPQWSLVASGHSTGVPAGGGWDCDVALR